MLSDIYTQGGFSGRGAQFWSYLSFAGVYKHDAGEVNVVVTCNVIF